jgi:hypothetical protein
MGKLVWSVVQFTAGVVFVVGLAIDGVKKTTEILSK